MRIRSIRKRERSGRSGSTSGKDYAVQVDAEKAKLMTKCNTDISIYMRVNSEIDDCSQLQIPRRGKNEKYSPI